MCTLKGKTLAYMVKVILIMSERAGMDFVQLLYCKIGLNIPQDQSDSETVLKKPLGLRGLSMGPVLSSMSALSFFSNLLLR